MTCHIPEIADLNHVLPGLMAQDFGLNDPHLTAPREENLHGRYVRDDLGHGAVRITATHYGRNCSCRRVINVATYCLNKFSQTRPQSSNCKVPYRTAPVVRFKSSVRLVSTGRIDAPRNEKSPVAVELSGSISNTTAAQSFTDCSNAEPPLQQLGSGA